MNTKSSGLIIVLAVIAAVLGWRYFTRPTYIGPQPTIPSVEPTATPTPAPQHTKEELGKLLMLPLTVTASKTGIATSAATLQYLKTYSPGFVLFFGDAISTQSASAARQTLLAHTNHIPALAVDHEGGSVQRLSGLGFTKLPSFRDVCKLPTEERRALFSQSAQELQAAGVTVVLGPVIDVAVDNSVLTDRICSKDKGVVTAVAQEFITEFQKRGITPVLKHYPGIGGTTKDLHKSIDAITESPAEISIYQSLLRIYPSIGVMVAHVLVTDLAEDKPCSLSPTCVRSLKKIDPEVLIFTDALEMASALTGPDLVSKKQLVDVSREALLAGNDVLVYGKGVTPAQLSKILETLMAEYDTNELLRLKVNQALDRVAVFEASQTAQNK